MPLPRNNALFEVFLCELDSRKMHSFLFIVFPKAHECLKNDGSKLSQIGSRLRGRA